MENNKPKKNKPKGEKRGHKINGAHFKMVILGDKDVGKTTLFNQYLYGQTLKTQMTIGAYFSKKQFTAFGDTFEGNVWDTAGEEKFHSLTKFYTRGAEIAIIVYDITNRSTWEGAIKWCEDLDDECIIIIFGNKVDLKTQRKVSFNEVSNFCKEKGYFCMEGSAITSENVTKTLQLAVEEWANKFGYDNNRSDNRNNSIIRLDSTSKTQKSCC